MITVRVYGEERTARAFRSMSLKVKDLSAAWDRIGARIKSTAVPLTPVLSGALVKTLRTGRSKSQAIVRAGGMGLEDYAGVQNYGWPGHNIAAKHFLNRALVANEEYAEQEVMSEVERIARRVGLK